MHEHLSVWAATAPDAQYGPLPSDLHADVCIVGAGIAGLTTAYVLAQAGKSVAVLDDGPPGSGMSQMTTGHVTYMMDDRYFELEKLHGTDGMRLAAESHLAAVERVESIVNIEEIDCDFSRLDGYLFLASDDSDETLQRELLACHRAGLSVVTRLERAPFSGFDTGPCLRFPSVAQFHVLKYLAGLAEAIEDAGGLIFSATHVDSVKGGKRAIVRAGERTVTANAVVVATNVPINDRLAIHTKQAPYMTYVIAATIPRGSVPEVLAWDTGDPYHYIRTQPFGEEDLLIVGGEDHKSGQAHDADRRYARLEAWTRERFPMIGEVRFAWGGQVMETVDYLAFIGRNPADDDNVYVVTGDSGMGLTHGTIAGMLLPDLILGRENAWAKLYNPSRKTVGAALEYASENLNVARQYAQWLTPGEAASADEIQPDHGAILRRGLTKLAVYRDPSGGLHERHAACPHLGCVVQWNDAEKTWDCPCHGSRFDRFGDVINGPANRALRPADARASGKRAA